jgi:hypothetical protein
MRFCAFHGRARWRRCGRKSKAVATRPQSVPETIRELTAEFDRLMGRGRVARVDVTFVRRPAGGTAAVEQRQSFPIDPGSFAVRRRGRHL